MMLAFSHLRVEDFSHTRSPDSWVDIAAAPGVGDFGDVGPLN